MIFRKLRLARDNLRRNFAAQYDMYNGQLVYRQQMKGAPFAVTAQERDKAITRFDQDIKRLAMLSIPILLLSAFTVIGLDEMRVIDIPDWVPLAIMVAELFIFMVLLRRAIIAPSRDLVRRAPMGRERTAEELKTAYLRQASWGSLAVPLPIGGVAMWVAIFAKPEFKAEHPVITVMIGLFGLLMLFGGIAGLLQKWRAGRQ